MINKLGGTYQQSKMSIAKSGHPHQSHVLDTIDTEYQKVQVASAHLRE